MMEWQPIETAPKDGTRVLVFDAAWCGGKPMQSVSYWQWYERIDDGSRQRCGSWSGVTVATHWMPLPDPPRSKGSET